LVRRGQTALALREALARGATFQSAGEMLARPPRTLYDLAQRLELPHRRRALDAAKEDRLTELLDSGESERAIAAKLEIGKGTIYRRKEARRKRLGQPKTVRPYRCQGPCGQMVIYVPCQICVALEAAQQQTAIKRAERAKAIAATYQRRAQRDSARKAGRESEPQ
jgi:hypothetical protein